MRTSRLTAAALAALLAMPTAAASQAPDSAAAADTSAKNPNAGDLPLKPTRTVKFTTDEGTWMQLDVSPDGRTIVFDLVGDLYTVPVTGGKATRITEGMAFDVQPRFSPDGRTIAFVSDRSGSDNLWVMDASGKNARAITKMDKRQFVSPEWTPDGKYIVVSRNAALFNTQYDLFLYHKDGGSGLKMTSNTPAPAAGQGGFGPQVPNNYVGAAFGKDGRYVYAATRTGGSGGYNQTSYGWEISVYDRETGQVFPRTNSQGGGLRPVLSPDGRYMVYGTRADSVTSLRLRDLVTGDESRLVRNFTRDDMESRFSRDLLPGSAFTPDSKALITSYGGRMWRVEVPSGKATQIPFTADVDQQLGPLSQFAYKLNDSTLTVNQIRGARPSPDGRRLAFTALDKLWIMDLPSGTPRRVAGNAGAQGEHSPVWSPDGRYVAYITWTEEGGDIYRIRTDGKSKPERLSRASAYYTDLNYTPDGTKLVMSRGPRQPRIQEGFVYGRELVWIPSIGGEATVVTPLGNNGWPHFTRASDRIYLYDFREGLLSMRWDGTDRKALLKVTGNPDARQTNPQPVPADEVLISPDGDRALVQVDNNVFVVTIPLVGGPAPTVSVANPAMAAVPVKRLTRIGGDFAGWEANGRNVFYSIGHSYFTYDLAKSDSLVRDSTQRADSSKKAAGGRRREPGDSARRVAADSMKRAGADSAKQKSDTAKSGRAAGEAVALNRADSAKVARSEPPMAKVAYDPNRLDVLITVPRDKPAGTVVFRGARIISMKGDEVIENGDIVVTSNRIAAVGPSGSVAVPAGARSIDASGKTIMPGFIDVHAHLRPPFGIHRSQVWEYLANIAYGVTTTRDPQTSTTDVLSYGDLVETGDIIGPRIFSTGPGVFWSDDIKSLNDARDVLRRYTDYYNIHTIKQYMVGDRKVRQWVVMASHELGLSPTLEGGLDFKKNLTEAIDGYAGSEHSYPIAPLYKDNVELIAQSGITYTPTLLVEYGGPWAENYWYQRYDILSDAKLGRFTPRAELMQRGLRRSGWWHPSQYSFQLQSSQAKKIVEKGGKVGVGSHGQLQGLGFHWELWTIASGGMKTHDALRTATLFGAQALGLDKDLGSVEQGKLADLVILNANPLTDIQNTNTVSQVMKNGRLYNAETMAEVWPRQRELPKPWWHDLQAVVSEEGHQEP